MRMRDADRRTLPSSRCVTPSARAISWGDAARSRYGITLVREDTRSDDTFDSVRMTSSVNPSAK